MIVLIAEGTQGKANVHKSCIILSNHLLLSSGDALISFLHKNHFCCIENGEQLHSVYSLLWQLALSLSALPLPLSLSRIQTLNEEERL